MFCKAPSFASHFVLLTTDQDMKREEDKWNHALQAIESRLNKRNYIAVLELVEEFLSHTKFPQQRLPALMKKAMCCFGAWKDERK